MKKKRVPFKSGLKMDVNDLQFFKVKKGGGKY